ncbi:MAG: hypothetical protein M1812_002180 [Candelaria pacifica]|nr:MAG: hypothetical protein M1812_002180 [Candelaria pacifica]
MASEGAHLPEHQTLHGSKQQPTTLTMEPGPIVHAAILEVKGSSKDFSKISLGAIARKVVAMKVTITKLLESKNVLQRRARMAHLCGQLEALAEEEEMEEADEWNASLAAQLTIHFLKE